MTTNCKLFNSIVFNENIDERNISIFLYLKDLFTRKCLIQCIYDIKSKMHVWATVNPIKSVDIIRHMLSINAEPQTIELIMQDMTYTYDEISDMVSHMTDKNHKLMQDYSKKMMNQCSALLSVLIDPDMIAIETKSSGMPPPPPMRSEPTTPSLAMRSVSPPATPSLAMRSLPPSTPPATPSPAMKSVPTSLLPRRNGSSSSSIEEKEYKHIPEDVKVVPHDETPAEARTLATAGEPDFDMTGGKSGSKKSRNKRNKKVRLRDKRGRFI